MTEYSDFRKIPLLRFLEYITYPFDELTRLGEDTECPEVEHEFTDSDIYDYFQYKTDNFNIVKSKMVLEDMRTFSVEFYTKIYEESLKMYKEWGEKLPMKNESNNEGKEVMVIDDSAMYIRTHTIAYSNLKKAIDIVENAINIESCTQSNKREEHPDIFCNNGFELFQYLLDEFIKPKGKSGRQSDVIYCHIMLYSQTPKYIHQRITPFLEWFNKEYEPENDIIQTKTYNQVKTLDREQRFSICLDSYQLRS